MVRWGEDIPGRWNSLSKGPETEANMECLGNYMWFSKISKVMLNTHTHTHTHVNWMM